MDSRPKPGRWHALVLWVVVAVLLTGCWDLRELEEIAFVMVLGLDTGPGNDLQVSAAIAIPHRLAGGGGGPGGGGDGGGSGGGGQEDSGPATITTVAAPTLPEAIHRYDTYIDRHVSLLHTKVLVLGEDFARAGGLDRVLDSLARLRELRRTVQLIVCAGTAADFLRAVNPVVEKDPLRYLEFLWRTAPETGVIPMGAELSDFLVFRGLQEAASVTYWAVVRNDDADHPAPPSLRRRGGPNVDLHGAAVFHRGRMVGRLNPDETRMYNALTGRLDRTVLTMADPLAPDKAVTVQLRRGRPPQVQAYWTGPNIGLQARLELEGDLKGVDSPVDYTAPANMAVLEQALSTRLTATTRALVARTQTEFGADIFGFAGKAARLFPTYPQWRAYGWDRHYPQAPVDVQMTVRLRRFGTQLAPPHRTGDQAPGSEGA